MLTDNTNRQSDNLLVLLNHLNRLQAATCKLLLTVRNYVYDEVKRQLNENDYPFGEVWVKLLDRPQIEAIVSRSPFNIEDVFVRYKINKLAKVNPRLAVMVASLVNPDKAYYITALADVGDVYERCFGRAITNETIWVDIERLRVLRISAMLRVIDMDDAQEIKPTLKLLSLTKEAWWQHVRFLEQLEIVEVYQESGYRFTDQIFATYAFYRCFFVRKCFCLAMCSLPMTNSLT